jgi:AbrB family looped-hinge helix DNA binding protein
MKLNIDRVGRIVIPKPMRKRLGLTSGTELEAVEQQGGVLLRPIVQKPSLIKVDGVWVHQGTSEPGANWERLVDDAREERIRDLLKPR